MTKKEQQEKRNWFLFMVGYFTAGYLTINWIISHRSDFFDISISLDENIPFIPIFIFGYILVYLSVALVYFVIKDLNDWHRAIVSFLMATTLAYAVFLFFPVRMNLRPVLANLTGISASVTRFYYLIDLPHNCFPSLHVTYPSLATLIVWRRHNIMRWVFLAMTLVVAVSVVLVKQHYIADVIGGFVNAGLCFWVTIVLEKYWAKFFKPPCSNTGGSTPSSVVL